MLKKIKLYTIYFIMLFSISSIYIPFSDTITSYSAETEPIPIDCPQKPVFPQH